MRNNKQTMKGSQMKKVKINPVTECSIGMQNFLFGLEDALNAGIAREIDMSAELEKDNVANEKKANIVWECNEFCNCQNCKEVA